MKSASWMFCGLVSTGGVIGSVFWARSFSLPHRVGHPRSKAEAPELDDRRRESSSGTSEEVRRLRAELRKKDALLAAVLSAQKGAVDTPVPSVPIPPPENSDPVARAIDTLDERMLTGPRDPRRVSELERELKAVVDSSALGDARVASLYCGGSNLCRLTLSGSNDSVVDQSISTLAGNLPKTFGATTVLRLGGGESAIYLAQSSDDLDVEPDR